MPFRFIRLALLTAMAATGQPAQAAPETLPSGIKLELPDPARGWVRKETKGNTFVLQKNYPANEERRKPGGALIQLVGPITSGGFEANWNAFIKGIPEIAAEKPMLKGSGTTINGHAMRTEYRCCAYRQNVSMGARIVGIATKAGPQHFLMLLTMNLRGEPSKEVEADFEALVRSLQVAEGDRPFGLVPTSDDGGLDGVFTYLDTGIRPNAFGGTDFYAESRIMAFDPKGLYSTEVPKGGASIAEHCTKTPNDCGTYRLTGGLLSANQIQLSEVSNDYGLIETETKPFSRRGKDLKVGERIYKFIPPLPAGTPYEGSWTYTWASSGMTATSSGGVSTERTLRMTRSGEFWRTGFTGVMSSNEIGGSRTSVAGSSKKPAEHGRYEVAGYGIKLVGDDGRTETLSVFQPDGNSDGLLVINGANYLKHDRKK